MFLRLNVIFFATQKHSNIREDVNTFDKNSVQVKLYFINVI